VSQRRSQHFCGFGFLANLANEWFEARVPDVERTTAQDGFAARVGAPRPVRFPGRELLFARSHLALAARRIG